MLTEAEEQLIAQLRKQPALLSRFQNILGITRAEGAAGKTADEVEGLLIEEMRRLGHAGMSQWAAQAEEQVSQEVQREQPRVRSRKKNVEVVVRVRTGDGPRAHLAYGHYQLSAAFARALGRVGPAGVPAGWTGC